MTDFTDLEQQKRLYDAACKAVLSERDIIANILPACVTEFAECAPEEIAANYLVGRPEVGLVAVEPDGVRRIESAQTEDKTEHEGTVFYDIRFHALVPGSQEELALIINIEAQNQFHPGYPLLKRAIYYCARLISSQYGTVFTKSAYGKIRKVYSIWVCTTPTREWEYTINRYHMTEEHLAGAVCASREHYDLLVPVLICLGNKRYTELSGIFRLLNLLLLDNVGFEQKAGALSREFGVNMTPRLEKGVAEMCNLSDGLLARGFARGEESGFARGEEREKQAVAMRMIARQRYAAEEIAELSGLPLAAVLDMMQGQTA